MLLALVTPAWRRFEMTAACLAQREHLANGLPDDVDLVNIVVARDKNLGIAKDLGMTTISAPNQLGRRFNDGIERAFQMGADYIALVGSDNWVHPSYFAMLGELGDQPMTAQDLGIVNEDGTVFARALCSYRGGVGPRTYPRALLERSTLRPCREDMMNGCDDDIHRGIVAALPRREVRAGNLRGVGLPFVWNDNLELGPLRYLDFKSPDTQIHPYGFGINDRITVKENEVPWEAISDAYSPELVSGVRSVLESRQNGS